MMCDPASASFVRFILYHFLNVLNHVRKLSAATKELIFPVTPPPSRWSSTGIDISTIPTRMEVIAKKKMGFKLTCNYFDSANTRNVQTTYKRQGEKK